MRFVIALNRFKLPMKVIDRNKTGPQHFLENSFKKFLKKKNLKNTQKCLLRHGVRRVSVSFCMLFLNGPFCHGALKLYIICIYIVYTILCLSISSLYIIGIFEEERSLCIDTINNFIYFIAKNVAEVNRAWLSKI